GIVPGADVQLGTHLRLPEGAELLSDAEPRGARAPAEPDVEEGVSRAIRVGPGIDRDAVISAGDQPTVPVVDPGMGVLVIAGATSLAIAAGIASVIGETEREPMVPAEPDVVRAPLPEDPVDRAQLLTARGLAADHSRSAEDVVVRHADSGSSEHDPIRIAALVDARVGAAVIRTVPVPLVLAAFLALVPDERARTRPARDADRGRRRKARTRRGGRAVRQVAVRMEPVGDGELLEAPAATALHEHAGGAAGDPDVAVLVSGRSHHVPGRGRQSVAGEMPAVAVRDRDHVAGVPWTRVRASVWAGVRSAVAGVRWPRVHAGVDACVDSSVRRRDDLLRSAAAAGDCH